MNDLWLIVLVVAGLHLFEAVRIVRSDAVLLLGRAERGRRVVDPERRGLPIDRGSVAVLGAAWPLSRVVPVDPWPVRATPQGVVLEPPHFRAPHLPVLDPPPPIPLRELAEAERQGKSVRLGAGRRFALSTATGAEVWTRRLRGLAGGDAGSEAHLGDLARLLGEDLDVPALAARAATADRELVRARALGLATFAFFFVLLPANQLLPQLSSLWLAAVYLVLVVLAEVELWRVHRRLFPEHRGERWLRALTLPFYPVEIMHVASRTEAECLAPAHPLAAAIALGRPDQRDSLARRILLGLRHAPATRIDPHAKRLLERLAADAGLDLATLTAAPAQEDATCTAYCPLCDGQFQRRAGHPCPECLVVALRELRGEWSGQGRTSTDRAGSTTRRRG